VSKEDAKKSRTSWNERFALIRAGLMFRGYVQEQRIGLNKLVFLGRTNRWPHLHLAWSARLGTPENNPPYIQVMVMPNTAITKLNRLRQKTSLIDWSTTRVNFQLYNPKTNSWKTNLARLRNSFTSSLTLSKLNKEFNVSSKQKIFTPDLEIVKLLDLATFGMYLSSLESGSYNKDLQMSSESIKEKIESLQNLGVLQVQYFAYLSGLVSICLEIKGDINRIYAITRVLLKTIPSAKVLISEKDTTCYVIGRVPEQSAYEILTDYPKIAAEHDINLNGYRVSAYVDYLHNLHERLLSKDGTWNDDISGLLSQFRS
jgi:hypothetical protein